MTDRKRATREEAPFAWGAACGIPAYATLAGVRFDRLFTDVDAVAEAYEKGRPMAEKLFGPDVGMGGPMWAGISYLHVNALGSEMIFPEDSEVGQTHIYDSLDDGIRALERDVDFASQGMVPFYFDLWEKLKARFPEHHVPFAGAKAEGPVTTAWELRGHGFFIDVLAEPERAKEYMRLVTKSCVDFIHFMRRETGKPEFDEAGAGLTDDVAAMISPGQWPEMVMPPLEQYYSGLTSGRRSAHIEDLKVEHLRFLDEIGLDAYDPSVSPALTPALVRDNCSVPFGWRLYSMQYDAMTCEDIERWVVDSVADGASTVHTIVARTMCTEECAEKVRAFIRAARRVEECLNEGCPREELRARLSSE